MKTAAFPANEQERLSALRAYNILDTLNEEEYDRLTKLAAVICGVPISLVSLIDEKRQWFKSHLGLDISETPRDVAFCAHAINGTTLFEVEDASADERFKDNPLVVSDPNIRFYAGYPLIDKEGMALGTLCVIDKAPRKLTGDQRAALELLANQVIDLIQARKKINELDHFERLFNISRDVIGIVNTTGAFVKINPAFTRVLGLSMADLQNMTFADLVHPDEVAAVTTEIENLYKGAPSIGSTTRVKTKDGSYKTFDWMASLESETNNLFAIARDVTDEKENETRLKLSENKLRAFFEHSQGLMCTHDLQGRFITVNAAGAGLIGYTVEEMRNSTLFDIAPEANHPEIRRYLDAVAKNGFAEGVMAAVHKNGSTRTWMYNNVAQKDLDGNVYIIGNAIDITERYLLERDLLKTRDSLERINKVANVGGWDANLVKNTVFWSDVTREIYGVDADFKPEMWSSLPFYKEGESKKKLDDAIDKAVKTGKGWDLELQIVTRQGVEKWVRIIGEPKLVDGKCVELFGTLQDIDERKKSELEISRSRKLLNDVIGSATEVSIIATDTSGLITVFNKGAENMLGYTAEEMIGKQNPSIIHEPAEIQQRIDEIRKEYNVTVDGIRIFVYKSEIEGQERREWTYIKKDGSRIIVSLVITPIRDENGTIIGYLGISTDISKRKKAEAAFATEQSRLKAFVENAPAAVAMLDREFCYVAASKRWLEEYKIPEQDIIGRSHYDIFPNISDEWKAVHRRSLQGDVVKNDEECWRPLGWDHDQFLRWETRPWYLPDGSIGGIMMFTQDITDLIVHRQELTDAKRHAEMASVAKSEFLANMSHEIRTPLNGVIGFTDLVLKTELNETQQQYLSIVNNSANALLSIINDILDFSKIEAGKLELDIDKCDLYELSSESTDIITYQAQKKGLEVLLNISPELPRFIWADSVRVKQILVNLLGNAVKFTSVGEIELKVEALTDVNREQITYRFQVRDTGIGIKPEMQNKIFEAFAQEDPSTTKRYGGTGLGLTISNRLLALMGSKLKLKSTVGKGSTFYFDITLKSEQGTIEKDADLGHVKKVLIVDDNSNNRLILKQMMLLRNISSDEAQNGFEALQKLATGARYDIILMDYHMPYMDGLETSRKIRESFFPDAAEQPIFLLHSSSDDETIIKACNELGIIQRLIKPIKAQDMYHTMAKIFNAGKKGIQEEIPAGLVRNTENDISVLLAEDNEVNILLAKTVIHRIAPKAEIIVAVDGEEAIRLFSQRDPDIILMDIQMPVMNGYEATVAIRNIEREKGTHTRVPIVALTAGNVKGEREKCMAAGMDDFMAKPFVESSLEVLLGKWVWNGNRIRPGADSTAIAANRHFDPQAIQENFHIDDETLNEILKATIVQLQESQLSLEECRQLKDLTTTRRVGHKLYGTAVSTSLSELARIASTIEQQESYDEQRITELLNAAMQEIELVISLIEQKLA